MALNFASALLRANLNYELVSYDRLEPHLQAEFEAATANPDFYGILRSRPHAAALPAKVVTKDTAQLIQTLRQPGVMPPYLTRLQGGAGVRAVRELVLKDVLQVEVDGRFISGAEAYAHLQTGTAGFHVHGPLAELSHRALQYGVRLGRLEVEALSARLYFFNRQPASVKWRRDYATPARIRSRLGLADFDGYDSTLAEDFPSVGWWMWERRNAPRSRTAQGTCKLYLSPDGGELPQAFREALKVLTAREVRTFKVGCDVHGLLRPDKLVAYFDNRPSLEEVAGELAARLGGCKVQGVPFTSRLTEDGLISMGVDPPKSEHVLKSRWRESWRVWVTNRLAIALVQARQSDASIDAVAFALDRLRSEGVDVERWEIEAGRWGSHRRKRA